MQVKIRKPNKKEIERLKEIQGVENPIASKISVRYPDGSGYDEKTMLDGKVKKKTHKKKKARERKIKKTKKSD